MTTTILPTTNQAFMRSVAICCVHSVMLSISRDKASS